MTGMTARGMNYWESADGRDQRLIFAMNSLLQQLDAFSSTVRAGVTSLEERSSDNGQDATESETVTPP